MNAVFMFSLKVCEEHWLLGNVHLGLPAGTGGGMSGIQEPGVSGYQLTRDFERGSHKAYHLYIIFFPVDRLRKRGGSWRNSSQF